MIGKFLGFPVRRLVEQWGIERPGGNPLGVLVQIDQEIPVAFRPVVVQQDKSGLDSRMV
jgi:hypothetical protein